MLKKLVIKFSILISYLLFTGLIWGEDACKADASLASKGFTLSPSPSTKLSKAKVNKEYSVTISMKTPTSTTEINESSFISCNGFVPDDKEVVDIKVSKIGNLPEGIEYKCDSDQCKWDSGKLGCIKFFGKPKKAGSFNIKVTVVGKGKVLFMTKSVTCNISGYKIEVE